MLPEESMLLPGAAHHLVMSRPAQSSGTQIPGGVTAPEPPVRRHPTPREPWSPSLFLPFPS